MMSNRGRDVCTECKRRADIDLPLCPTCNRPFCALHIYEPSRAYEGHICRLLKYKMVFLVRKDLNMSPGKVAAQVGHAVATLATKSFIHTGQEFNGHPTFIAENTFKEWHKEGGRKVVLGVENEAEMLYYMGRADGSGVPTALVQDYGLTEVPKDSYTVLGIGPASAEDIDKITGKLKTL
jgi:PTH2 family peptidyl-tRNA hydrolase